MVHVKHEQTGISLEAAVDELQKDFESAMEAVLGAVRMKHGVTEQQMTQVHHLASFSYSLSWLTPSPPPFMESIS